MDAGYFWLWSQINPCPRKGTSRTRCPVKKTRSHPQRKQWQWTNNPPPQIIICQHYWPCYCWQNSKIFRKRPSCPENPSSNGWRPPHSIQILTQWLVLWCRNSPLPRKDIYPRSRHPETGLSQKIPWSPNHWTPWIPENQTAPDCWTLVARNGPLNPIISRETLPFKQISYNLITDLLVSNGFNSLLVMVDHGLSKGVILCPTKKTITTEGISTIIFRKLYTRFRLFNKIISDWGPQFAAKFQKELRRILRYKLALSLAYHPQTDGETKRVNQEIKTYLQIFCGSNSLEWTEQIPMAKFVHNIRPHSVTGKSPFYLIMGYEPQALPDITNKTNLPAVEKRLDEIVKARNKASAAHKLARQTMKNWIQSKFTPFINGDKVWLEARNLRRNIVNPKFATKREGPFKITKVLSSLSYQLEIPKTWKIHLVFHASLLTPYKENNIHGPNYPQPPPDLINGEEEYEVEWILKHQGCPKHHQYLIRWKGYAANEDSWQSEANLRNASELLQEYKKRAKLL